MVVDYGCASVPVTPPRMRWIERLLAFSIVMMFTIPGRTLTARPAPCAAVTIQLANSGEHILGFSGWYGRELSESNTLTEVTISRRLSHLSSVSGPNSRTWLGNGLTILIPSWSCRACRATTSCHFSPLCTPRVLERTRDFVERFKAFRYPGPADTSILPSQSILPS